jgi:hypothetical protein
METKNILQWIQQWFQSQCDGNWEHMMGITISTLDNPGWDIKIELEGTELEGLEMKLILNNIDDDDWYGLKVENNVFEAFGDPSKLEFLLAEFKKIVDNTISTSKEHITK